MKLHNVSGQIFVPDNKSVVEIVCDHIVKFEAEVKLKVQPGSRGLKLWRLSFKLP
jgi:hypothetical protein